MSEQRVNAPEWSVSELSAALRRTVEDTYGYVRVRGEISGYRGPHASGHAYFALKDDGARIDAVVWKTALARMRIKPQDGLEVVATGRLTTYPGRSTYQIVIDSLAPAGVGALMALLEQRKRQLAAEGLFDAARKKPLPYLPGVVGVVTSPTGAVIRDILHRLRDRFLPHVLVWPVRVQGEGAAEEVAAAIHAFNALARGGPLARPDVIIVARGGGSIEDLWPFNEEAVVRAAAASAIPLISAVGHETDVTLIDFAADRRAPTPTAAAEMAVPVRTELIARLDGLARRALASWNRGQEERRADLRAAARALPAADALMAVPRQRLDSAADRLPRALLANARLHHAAYARIAGRLTAPMVGGPIAHRGERLSALSARAARAVALVAERRFERFTALAGRLGAGLRANALAQGGHIAGAKERTQALAARGALALARRLDRDGARLAHAAQLLVALSYHGVLARGFALVRSTAGRPLRSAAAVSPGTRVDIEFADGRVRASAEVRDLSGPATARAPPRRRRPPDPGQGSLF